MTYSVYQHWDPLKVIVVGASYPPELYDYIKNEKVRKIFYKIAEETEEDYQKLISLLEKFNVQVLRPDMTGVNEYNQYCIKENITINKPSQMQPRDYTLMLGSKFCFSERVIGFENIISHIKSQGNIILKSAFHQNLNGAMTTRLGKDLYVGTLSSSTPRTHKSIKFDLENIFREYRITTVDTQGHADGTFCPVRPGLLFTIMNFDGMYEKTFPGWEVVSIVGESWDKVRGWINLKNKNRGKWWVPGEELNDDFTSFVETWMSDWVGYVEESVFDINMLVIDINNVIVNGYNEKVFDAFARYNITPHICNFRHRYFWDGGIHCITSDLDREGVMNNYFPERD